MDKSGTTGQEEVNYGVAQPKKTFGSRLRRSCARFWWLYLLAFIALVLVIVLPMYDRLPHPIIDEQLLMIFQNFCRLSQARAEKCQRRRPHDQLLPHQEPSARCVRSGDRLHPILKLQEPREPRRIQCIIVPTREQSRFRLV